MNIAQTWMVRKNLNTTQFEGHSHTSTRVPVRYWYENISSFYNTGWFSSDNNFDGEDSDAWSKHIKMIAWCWHDFVRDKKFTYPVVCVEGETSYEIIGGGNHRVSAISMYNDLMETNYSVDALCVRKNYNRALFNLEGSRWHNYSSSQLINWNEYQVSFPNNNGEIEHIIIKDQKTENNSDGLDLVLAKIKSNWQEPIVIDNCQLFNTLWKTHHHETMYSLVEDLFSGDKPNVFLEPNDAMENIEDRVRDYRIPIFLCILLKIPVENQYFSLKFHK